MEVVLQEEQVILRVPTDVADLVRDAVKSGVGLDLVPLDESRRWRLTIPGVDHALLGVTMDLPCIVEAHKTLDRSAYYKAGNIGQVIVFAHTEAQLPLPGAARDGLTPAARDVWRKRFAKAHIDVTPAEIENIENKLLAFSTPGGKAAKNHPKPPPEMTREITLEYDPALMDEWPDVFTVERVEGVVMAATKLDPAAKERQLAALAAAQEAEDSAGASESKSGAAGSAGDAAKAKSEEPASKEPTSAAAAQPKPRTSPSKRGGRSAGHRHPQASARPRVAQAARPAAAVMAPAVAAPAQGGLQTAPPVAAIAPPSMPSAPDGREGAGAGSGAAMVAGATAPVGEAARPSMVAEADDDDEEGFSALAAAQEAAPSAAAKFEPSPALSAKMAERDAHGDRLGTADARVAKLKTQVATQRNQVLRRRFEGELARAEAERETLAAELSKLNAEVDTMRAAEMAGR